MTTARSTLARTLTRSGLAVATLVLTAGGLTACGGSDSDAASDGGSSSSDSSSSADSSDDSGQIEAGDGGDAPDDVSTDEFCSTYSSYIQELSGSFTSAGDEADLVPTLKKYAAELSQLGTPSDIPDDARKGFELSIDAINDLPDDATQADLEAAGSKFSAEEQAEGQAFSAYVTKTCPDLIPGASASPTS